MFRILKLSAILFFLSSAAASAAALSGKVADENGAPLAGVNVVIPALGKNAATEASGQFQFPPLPPGNYSVEFKHPQRVPQTRKVEIAGQDVFLAVVLPASLIHLPTLTITAAPQPTEVLTSPQSVHVIEGRQMNRQRGQNAMEAIQNTPGAQTLTTGSGIAKPVIRGLTSQRVLAVVDGIRQEGQQWGDEHGPEIDSLSVRRIEVLRGPNSLLYGSDAMGGVVNVTQADLPSVDRGDPKLGGEMTYNGFTNNRQNAGAFSLYGAAGPFGYRGQYTRRKAFDFATPNGDVRNSGVDEYDGNGTVGITQNWESFDLATAHFDERLQMPEDPAANTDPSGFQHIRHDKVLGHLNLLTDLARLEAVGGYQVNGRQEFENRDSLIPALNLWLRTATLDLKAHHRPIGPMSGTVGLSLMRQTNETLGTETLIPGYNAGNLGAFLYEEVPVQQFTFSAGVRGDWRKLDVNANNVLLVPAPPGQTPQAGLPAQTRNYSAASGALGAVWHALEPLAFAVNLGRGWRAPTVSELYAFGEHEGTGRYEVGDSNLNPEESFDIDTSIRYASGRIKAEATFFRNQIQHFIYPDRISGGVNPVLGQAIGGVQLDGDGNPVLDDDGNPVIVDNRDPDSGLPIFQTKQADAVLLGGEFSVEAQATDWLVLTSGFDLIRGTNETLQQPLPFVPANRARLGARLETITMGPLSHPYFSSEVKMTDTQNRLALGETRTGGYTLVDLGLGTEVTLFGNRMSFDFGVNNLFDRPYVDNLNRLKDFALNPGRNFFAKVTIPFDIVK